MHLKEHRPPHIYKDDSHYFITASTYQKEPILNTLEKQQKFTITLHSNANIYKITLNGWIILNNHYHLLLHIVNGKQISKFIRKLHSNISTYINKIDNAPGRKVWYQYWDRCIRSEKDYYMRLNYIHHNCIKHGYTKQMEDYKFSSYSFYLQQYGYEWLNECFSTYPIIDFTPEFNDDF